MSEGPGGVSRAAHAHARHVPPPSWLTLVAQPPGVLRVFFVESNPLLMQLTATQHARHLFPMSSLENTRHRHVCHTRAGARWHPPATAGFPVGARSPDRASQRRTQTVARPEPHVPV